MNLGFLSLSFSLCAFLSAAKQKCSKTPVPLARQYIDGLLLNSCCFELPGLQEGPCDARRLALVIAKVEAVDDGKINAGSGDVQSR